MPPRAHLQAGGDGQLVFRPHAHAQDHQLGRQRFARREPHGQPLGRLLEGLGRLPQQHPDAVGGERFEDGGGHFLVERRQHLVLQLDERGRDAAADEVFDQLQADETGPDHDCLSDPLVDALLDAIDVGQIPEREDAVQVDARNRRPQRSRPGGQNQLVIRFFVGPIGGEVANADFLGHRVDGFDRRTSAHVELEADAQPLGRRDEELVARGDFAPHVIGQAAVGKRHVRPALQQDDFGIFRQPAGPRGRRRSARHAPHDEQFHDSNRCAVPGGIETLAAACCQETSRAPLAAPIVSDHVPAL